MNCDIRALDMLTLIDFFISLAGVAVERPPRVRDIAGSIPGRVNHTKDFQKGINGCPPWRLVL